jgi:multidrug efflux pump subunit AcrA (membrane-fusion protein)
MTREDLTLALAGVLALAVLAGWVLHAMWARLRHGGAAGPAGHDEMALRLHEAHEAQDAARAELATRTAAQDAAHAQTEATLRRALAEREAELAAAMGSVGELRRNLGDWQRAYEDLASKPDP